MHLSLQREGLNKVEICHIVYGKTIYIIGNANKGNQPNFDK